MRKKKKTFTPLILNCIVLIMAGHAYTQNSVAVMGTSPLDPASTGTTVADIISCGSDYNSHETYDIKITLLEIVRGEEALRRISPARPTNQEPEAGLEYVLARIRFEYYARGKPGDCVYELNDEPFTTISSDGREYKAPPVAPPDPKFFGRNISSGDRVEGWAVFRVGKDDKKPLLTFGRTIWFRLD